jgi:hypothetical protein
MKKLEQVAPDKSPTLGIKVLPPTGGAQGQPTLTMSLPGGLSPPGTWVLVTPDEKAADPRTSDREPLAGPAELKRSDASAIALKPGALRGKGQRLPALLPPPLNTTPDVRHVFRFVNTSASNQVISFDKVRGALGGIAVTSTSVQPWASSIRILRVTVWPAPNATAADTTELFWESGTSDQVPDETRVTTLPEGVTVTRPVTFVPPPMSLASFWLSVAANIFAVRAPVGSVIDVHLGFRLSNVFGAGPIVVSSATPGNVYYLALDGPGSNTYVPVGVPTTS